MGAMITGGLPSRLTPGEGAGARAASAGDGTNPGKVSFFWILTLDRKNKRLTEVNEDAAAPPPQDPCDERARYIGVHLRRHLDAPPPAEELAFAAMLDKLPHVLNELYRPDDPATEVQFRKSYVEVFRLATLVLQEKLLTVAAGKTVLEGIERELIKDEGVRVKSKRIADLVRSAARLSVPALLAYVWLSLLGSGGDTYRILRALHVDPPTLASFMVLWLGCFLGVCLSFIIRNPQLTLDDLVATTEPDFLRPLVRLAFAGTLTMILAMLAMVGFVNLQVGGFNLAQIAEAGRQMFAFVVGVICGISELLLPDRIMGQKTLFGGIAKSA